MPFPYKHVLMVGATAGIGAAMADRLISEGAKVIAVGKRLSRVDSSNATDFFPGNTFCESALTVAQGGDKIESIDL